MIPQNLPEGDESKERTIRVTGDKKQIEIATDMIKEVMNQVCLSLDTFSPGILFLCISISLLEISTVMFGLINAFSMFISSNAAMNCSYFYCSYFYCSYFLHWNY